jgi:DNA repair exonuclease SbcCD ATPase subunit
MAYDSDQQIRENIVRCLEVWDRLKDVESQLDELEDDMDEETDENLKEELIQNINELEKELEPLNEEFNYLKRKLYENRPPDHIRHVKIVLEKYKDQYLKSESFPDLLVLVDQE